MAYQSQFKTPIDKIKRLSIKILKQTGFISPGKNVCGPLNWGENFSMYAEVDTEHTKNDNNSSHGHIILTHLTEVHSYDLNIKFISKKSNLNNNTVIWFLICPISKRLCRKLYFNGNLFVHHSQIDGLYTSQNLSKKARECQKIFQILLQPNNANNRAMQKHLKKTYRGKPTRKYTNLIRLKNKVDLITEEDIRKVFYD